MSEQVASERDACKRALPLSGVKVVDLTQMLAGPYCTWILASLGADVIKVERPGEGDFARGIAPFVNGESLYFQSVNRGKRSIALDLKEPRSRELLIELVRQADVFIENNRPGVMDRLGLGYEFLKALNSRLVYASISGFGHTSPHAHRPAFDTVIQAMSGLMSITGDPGGAPMRVGASISDISAGMFGAIGILAALAEAGTTGHGRFVDIAMLDAQLAMLENAAARFLNTGQVPTRVGNRHPLITPFQAFETADRPIVVCCDTEAQWTRFCQAIDAPELLEDERFTTAAARTANHAELEPLLAKKLRQRTCSAWMEALVAADVPVAAVNTIAEMFSDPHIEARSMVVRAGACRFVNFPLFQAPEQAPAPALDQHRDEIVAEARAFSGEVDPVRR